MSGSWTLFSDGGGQKGTAAASATILESGSQIYRVVTFLGGATNNEAEIFGGLIGFGLLRSLGAGDVNLRWVCDSEYVLKSATQYIMNWQRNGWKTAQKEPVKNQQLWQAYLELSRGFKILPEHVRGHTGHPENESCDSAATWAQLNGADTLSTLGEATVSLDFDWLLIDGRPHLEALRGSILGVSSAVANMISVLTPHLGVNTDERQFENLTRELAKIQERLAALDLDKSRKLAEGIRDCLKKAC